jgi:glucose-6-phosphate isomerase
VSPRTLGLLIALYERVVGLYASLVGINAYHQPGVEAGKKAAGSVIALKLKLMELLRLAPGTPFTAESAATGVGQPEAAELVFQVLEHVAANPETKVTKSLKSPWWESTYVYQD